MIKCKASKQSSCPHDIPARGARSRSQTIRHTSDICPAHGDMDHMKRLGCILRTDQWMYCICTLFTLTRYHSFNCFNCLVIESRYLHTGLLVTSLPPSMICNAGMESLQSPQVPTYLVLDTLFVPGLTVHCLDIGCQPASAGVRPQSHGISHHRSHRTQYLVGRGKAKSSQSKAIKSVT